MEKAKVYFDDFRAPVGTSVLKKLDRLIRKGRSSGTPLTFEIGSNSDLVLENTITGNLEWTITQFAQRGRGHITFPTKFHMVEPLLDLDHRGKAIFRMSVNPQSIISRIELGTSSLMKRIDAVNRKTTKLSGKDAKDVSTMIFW